MCKVVIDGLLAAVRQFSSALPRLAKIRGGGTGRVGMRRISSSSKRSDADRSLPRLPSSSSTTSVCRNLFIFVISGAAPLLATASAVLLEKKRMQTTHY